MVDKENEEDAGIRPDEAGDNDKERENDFFLSMINKGVVVLCVPPPPPPPPCWYWAKVAAFKRVFPAGDPKNPTTPDED